MPTSYRSNPLIFLDLHLSHLVLMDYTRTTFQETPRIWPT